MIISLEQKAHSEIAWYSYTTHGFQVQVYQLFTVKYIHCFGQPSSRTKVYVN